MKNNRVILSPILLVVVLLLTSFVPIEAQTGSINYEKMPCNMLQGVTYRDYTVYLPAGYDKKSSKRYHVMYLLHGGGCSNTEFAREGNLLHVADSLIAHGIIPEMVIICPEANKNNMIWFDAPHWKYESFFFNEFMPYVEKLYHVQSDKQHRSVAGFSMGGGAAVVYGIHHPECFTSVYDMSGYLRRQPLEFLKNDKSGEWRQQIVENNNPIKTIIAASEDDIKRFREVKWFVDCGDDDFTFDANIDFIRALRSRGISSQLRIKDGNHNWDYWRQAMCEAICEAFK